MTTIPDVEPLEVRALLSFLQPFGNKFSRVRAGGVIDLIAVSGPGQVFTRRIDRDSIAITLGGTTQDTTVTVSSLGAHPGASGRPLQVANILVKTGRLGSFNGINTVDLNGPLSPLIGPVNMLQFDAVGPATQIDVAGNLGTLNVNRGVELGRTGHINVSNDLTASFSVSRDVTLDGGQINVGRDLLGSVNIGGNLTVVDGGQFFVSRNLSALSSAGAVTGATISGNLTLDSGGKLVVGGNASSITVGGNIEASSGGGLVVGGNLGSLTVNGGGGSPITGNVTLNPGGEIFVGHNLSTLTVGSNLQIFQDGQISVAGNLTNLSVLADLLSSDGGEIHVTGNLGTLSVTGVVRGDGVDDIAVGDNLAQLTVLGGGPGMPGLERVGINVGKNIQGVDIRNGVFFSSIKAGILIDGGTAGPGTNGWNIGPDGFIAVFDSEIRAGFEIRNFVIGGDVVSDLPENPTTGLPTRIVAGEDPAGNFAPGGIIDSFQIIGRLVDAVLAASVQPFGGPGGDHGSHKTYDEPGETYFRAPKFKVEPSTDLVLSGGAINPSFSTKTGPTKSTVLAGVVSTPHGEDSDFAGEFAADTSGVIVGPLPPKT